MSAILGDVDIGGKATLESLLRLRDGVFDGTMAAKLKEGSTSSLVVAASSPATVKAPSLLPESARSRQWQEKLAEEIEDLERRTREAVSRAEHPSAKRAVSLLARRDLLDVALEGAAEVFSSAAGAATTAASTSTFLVDLRATATSLLDAWRSLLEECESEAETELRAAERRAREAERRAERAEAELRESKRSVAAAAPSLFVPDAIAAVTVVPSSASEKVERDKKKLSLLTRKDELSSSPTSPPNAGGDGKKRPPPPSEGEKNGKSGSRAFAKAPPASRLPPTEAEARALLAAERVAEGGGRGEEGEDGEDDDAFRMPPTSVDTPLPAEVLAAAASAEGEGGAAPAPPLSALRSSSSAMSLLLLGLPASEAALAAAASAGSLSSSSPAPRLSLRALTSVLDDVFDCKRRADERARRAGAARPSLSEFLDTYLLGRFGRAAFGAVAREWRNAIEATARAAHEAVFPAADDGKASAPSLSSSSSAALVEAAAFHAMLHDRIDEGWWDEASRLRASLGVGGGGGGSGWATPVATSAPSSPRAAPSPARSLAHLPPQQLVERGAWSRALDLAMPTRGLAREAAARVERAISTSTAAGDDDGSAAPRSLVLACALRASLEHRVRSLAPAADAFASAAAAAEDATDERKKKTSLGASAFRDFCRKLSPGMRAGDVAALLDALAPREEEEVAWSTAASALAAELEREEEGGGT